MCRWPGSAEAWLESSHPFGFNSFELLESFIQDGLSSRIHPAFCPVTKGEILPRSFEGWSNAGMACAGGYLMLDISEWPNAGAVCSLSEVLETDVPRKYYLSSRAAAGILRRAEKRRRELPPLLLQALQALATRLGEGERTT